MGLSQYWFNTLVFMSWRYLIPLLLLSFSRSAFFFSSFTPHVFVSRQASQEQGAARDQQLSRSQKKLNKKIGSRWNVGPWRGPPVISSANGVTIDSAFRTGPGNKYTIVVHAKPAEANPGFRMFLLAFDDMLNFQLRSILVAHQQRRCGVTYWYIQLGCTENVHVPERKWYQGRTKSDKRRRMPCYRTPLIAGGPHVGRPLTT